MMHQIVSHHDQGVDVRPARYEGSRGINPIASALVVLVTTSILIPLFLFRFLPDAQKLSARIEVVNLEMPAPPSPPADPPPASVPQPPAMVHAPVPLVPIPAFNPPILAVQAEPSPPAPAPAADPAPAAPPAPPAPAKPVSAGDLSASMVHAPPPRYPRESRRQREQGAVLLTVLLGTDGSVADISVAKSSGHRRLDDAALSAVRKWRWRPTIRQGQPVQVRGSVEIPFVLSGTSSG